MNKKIKCDKCKALREIIRQQEVELRAELAGKEELREVLRRTANCLGKFQIPLVDLPSAANKMRLEIKRCVKLRTGTYVDVDASLMKQLKRSANREECSVEELFVMAVEYWLRLDKEEGL